MQFAYVLLEIFEKNSGSLQSRKLLKGESMEVSQSGLMYNATQAYVLYDIAF